MGNTRQKLIQLYVTAGNTIYSIIA